MPLANSPKKARSMNPDDLTTVLDVTQIIAKMAPHGVPTISYARAKGLQLAQQLVKARERHKKQAQQAEHKREQEQANGREPEEL